MNTPFEKYVDAIFVLSLKRRTDRRKHCEEQFARLGITEVEFIDGYDRPVNDSGRPDGNFGCTSGHRSILEIIRYRKLERVAVFEDDMCARPEFLRTFHQEFSSAMAELPAGFKLCYLGAGYASNPKRKVSPRIIEVDRMMTTSSFIITGEMAQEMAPYIYGGSPIDILFSRFTEKGNCYCITPRLFTQYKSMSDLTDQEVSYDSMLDSAHEEMLLDGQVEVLGPRLILNGRLQRRELAAPHDMDGTEVIVEGKLYRIVSLQLPQHRASWFRDEPVTYILKEA